MKPLTQREFEIRIGHLIMAAYADGIDQRSLIEAMEIKLAEEKRLAESRRAAVRSY